MFKRALKLAAYSLAALAALISVVTVIALYIYVNQPPTATQTAFAAEMQRRQIEMFMGAGCAAASRHDEQLSYQVNASRGMICVQIVGREMEANYSGKGQCKSEDAYCLFSTAYLLTLMRSNAIVIDTNGDLSQVEQLIDDDFEKLRMRLSQEQQ